MSSFIFILYKKLVMSLKLSLGNFQVLGFVCDLDFIVIFPLILECKQERQNGPL